MPVVGVEEKATRGALAAPYRHTHGRRRRGKLRHVPRPARVARAPLEVLHGGIWRLGNARGGLHTVEALTPELRATCMHARARRNSIIHVMQLTATM